MKTIYDNINNITRADDRFVLEEDENGLLYETSNAVTRQLVCSAMFVTKPSYATLLLQFPEEIADRYSNAIHDYDK